MENKISTVIAQQDYDNIIQQLEAIDALMPFLLNLDATERQGGFKLGDKNLAFLEKGKDYITQKPEYLPDYFSKVEVEKDAQLASQLYTISRKLRILADKVDDTASLAGTEALAGVLAYYNTVKQAARNNVTGAQTIYDDLGKRFPGRPKNNTNNNQ